MPDIWMDVDAALAEVPVNIYPLTDDTDFKTREESVTFNQAGLDLVWNFTTTAGAFTQTAVTPTDTAGDYDWVNQGNGYYTIEIPASGGASINNDTEGFGFFSGFATGILPWRGPVVGFRAAALNDALIDGGDVLDVNLTEIGGVAQSAVDLKDFADSGYDPATNKVEGVKLVDTTTANSDMRGTENAALAASALTDVTWTDAKAAFIDAAISGRAPGSEYDTEMARITGNVALASGVDLTHIMGTILTEGGAGRLAAAFIKLLDVATPLLVASDVMRGTDGANTVEPDPAGTAATPAEVNAEVVDVMKTDTIAEPTQGVPPTTPTFEEAIIYLYEALTKKVDVDASLKEFYNNAGAVIWKKSVADDGSNYNEDKGQSGP